MVNSYPRNQMLSSLYHWWWIKDEYIKQTER